VRMTVERTEIGPGSLARIGVEEERAKDWGMSIWTCILHFTSSIGVLMSMKSELRYDMRKSGEKWNTQEKACDGTCTSRC
jgi:hypothetical protein